MNKRVNFVPQQPWNDLSTSQSISGFDESREIYGIHLDSRRVPEIRSGAADRLELELLVDGDREQVRLCPPQDLASAPDQALFKQLSNSINISIHSFTPALATAKVEHPLIGAKYTPIIQEPLRAEQMGFLKDGFGVVDGTGVIVDLSALRDVLPSNGGVICQDRI